MEKSRLETFCNAALAFAVISLVVSEGSIPSAYEVLPGVLRDMPPLHDFFAAGVFISSASRK